VGIAGSCTYSWTSQFNTNVNDGRLASTGITLTTCQQACIADDSCTGVDWIPAESANARSCWMSGPWSGTTNVGTAVGVTHYTITRNCPGQTYSKMIKITISQAEALVLDTLGVVLLSVT